ncbi:hypothetical protein D7X94_08710 [Acutalibacter sp. 1XD8-33]|uniref:hypothetical protein n=1 Tax=Acutalibacter sp. 1XD8-33 TaxID=2320081 RepID=UPI000EA2350A|nr:hypothetical protein [Acutalibacter sp. 1XD8-33]RKJ40217.1 hypothetical protein D7X94_08710 [Acutalibacter sp. 1XD8-33]
MNEWGVVGVIVALVGLIAAVVGPMIKVSSTLTRISTILDGATERLNKLETADRDFQESARQAHSRLHDRIDGVDSRVNNHEVRISTLEHAEKL